MKTCEKCQAGSKQRSNDDDKLMEFYRRLGLELRRHDTGFRLVTAADVDTGKGCYDTYDYDEGKRVSRAFVFGSLAASSRPPLR